MERYPSSLKESTSSGLPSSASIATYLASPESLSTMIEKRTSSWRYIQQSHSASSEPWFETAQVSRSQVDRHLAETLGSVKATQKTRNLFVLGMSLGPVLGADNATDLCRSLARILDEWELWNENAFSGRASGVSNGVKNLFRNQRVGRKSGASSTETANEHNGWNAGNSSTHQGIDVTRAPESALVVINVPFALDYCQVVTALSDVIRQIYARIGVLVLQPSDARSLIAHEKSGARGTEAPVSWPASLTNLITKADQKLKKILHSIVQEMEHIAQTATNHQLETLMRNLSATFSSVLVAEKIPVMNLLHEPGEMTG